MAVLVCKSRADKFTEIATEQVRQQQQARLSPEKSTGLDHLRGTALEQSRSSQHELSPTADSLQHAKSHLFERRSVICDHELLTKALRYGRGRVDLGLLRGTLEIERSHGTVVHAGNRLANTRVWIANST